MVPQQQEFTWSDGGLPQVFDPAFAAAPPDTDAVRALFEGLTDYDSTTLKPLPAVATRWESSPDNKVWTFYLRSDARWSTGETVTARDFVNSWERTLRLGDQVPHTDLFSNIVGAKVPLVVSSAPPPEFAHGKTRKQGRRAEPAKQEPVRFGVEAVNDQTLRVHLDQANPDFPSLVAHPVFRPVKLGGDVHARVVPSNIICNGAFTLAEAHADRVLLERAKNYWDHDAVNLDRVKFVPLADAEKALTAYQKGDVDAVTNAPFEPLALKLFEPYKDYHRTTYSALTYYSFNLTHTPFDDVRVREALAIAIDRERISDDELRGATEPADKFLPVPTDTKTEAVVPQSTRFAKDVTRARGLLTAAGFPGGRNFPTIRLLINRNDQQRQVAQAIASMWRANLNLDTQIVVRNWDEYEATLRSGEYDVVRRGAVMQTMDELTSMSLLFPPELKPPNKSPEVNPQSSSRDSRTTVERPSQAAAIASEAEALNEVRAIPIYFASSYSLVKPYVNGFDANLLDAPSLKKVRIDTAWREPKGR